MIALNAAWNIVNFRAGIVRALIEAGYEVVAVAPPDEYAERVRSMACRFVPLTMDNTGTDPLRDALLLFGFWRILRRERPACLLCYTVKPNVYGSLAARSLDIPVINNIAGLGTAFLHGGMLNRVVTGLYRIALARSARVFFQNGEDQSLFVERGLVRAERAARLPGSGIDLDRFQVVPMPERGHTVFLLVARLLWDKGVGEYIEAARQIKARHPAVVFRLLGFLGAKNRTAVPAEVVQQWVQEGLVEYLGSSDDVRPFIADADCVVLPSYREGTPRSLLEAAAIGRPVITSNAVGCREVVDHGLNGLLCQPRDGASLARQMEDFLALSATDKRLMGMRGRLKMERQFDERVVVERYLEAVGEVVRVPCTGRPN
jgi:glycosyltransferase involved in cell wall biosynthesis